MNATVDMITTQMIQLYAWKALAADDDDDDDDEGVVEIGKRFVVCVKVQAHLEVQDLIEEFQQMSSLLTGHAVPSLIQEIFWRESMEWGRE